MDTTNEGLEDLNSHSRGIASRDDYGCSTVQSRGHRGNLGFTDTSAVDPGYYDNLKMATISVQSLNDLNGGGCNTTGEPGVRSISGTIGETVNGLRVTDVEIRGVNGVLCDRTPDGFECFVPDGAINPRMDIYGYDQTGQNRWACLTGNYLVLDSEVTNGVGSHAVFSLEADPLPSGSGYNINIQSTSCN